ncbi:hypothetical protein DXV75_07955 [Alteromonas aestuariivivens]|uniref:Uncharacterized protein n=1 Tax=Alteromonas aestuariivivens TaxID=1938339 RepID=A0A3D8M819_9ALTE|nr:VC2046/SO_2500 family protein [Alteromonas aestuariivivens]RDV26011.1 hypothetical protein DXV75_07955 [Alteromonas aestuariivivens]
MHNSIHSKAVGDHEWSGNLARAAGKGAVFSLFLAMHVQPGRLPSRISEPAASDPDKVVSPTNQSHYRNPPLQTDEQDVAHSAVSAKLLAARRTADLSLWQAMHPEPLAVKNDPQWIDPGVIANCSIATQSAFRGGEQPLRVQQPENLADIIPVAQTLLRA